MTTRPMNVNQPQKAPGKTRSYLIFTVYGKQIGYWRAQAGHATAEQHDRADYHYVTTGCDWQTASSR